jgi:hypothetical protein
MNQRHFKIAALIIAAIVFGFLLEMVKVNVNYLLETSAKIPGYYASNTEERKALLEQVKINAPYDYYHNHKRIDTLISLSQGQLEKLKWVVTLLGIAVFLGINSFLVKYITQQQKLAKWTVWLYAIFFFISLLFFVFGKVTHTHEYAYGISRKIAGALQSMVPLMLLLPGWWLWKSTQAPAKI